MGPQGKDGYIHLDDARSLLRIEDGAITEIAVKLRDFKRLGKAYPALKKAVAALPGAKGGFETHSWEELSPFSSIAKIVTLLILVVRLVLVFIVLVSILNVMMMSVYERIGEIGTIASIGTPPSKILALFLVEGLSLGLFSGLLGSLAGAGILLILQAVKLKFTFGAMDLVLAPAVPLAEMLLSLAVVVTISTLASLQPALKASRMEPVEALRHV